MKKKIVAVYARVSTDKQKVDMQLQELDAFIKRSGWTLYKQYIDHGYTGAFSKRKVPGVHSREMVMQFYEPAHKY